MKEGGHFALIVGHNHTKVEGARTDIDTPYYLTLIGANLGFTIKEIAPLEAYQRYGLNSSNAVEKESLIVFKKIYQLDLIKPVALPALHLPESLPLP